MNVISRLFIMFDQVWLQMHRPVGQIFDYCNGFNGLKMIAEAVQRGRPLGIASFIIPPDGHHSIQVTPSGRCHSSFLIDDKVQRVKNPKNYLVLMQFENFLWTGNSLMAEIDEEGTEARLYLNYRDRHLPMFLTELDMSYIESEHQLMERVFKLAIGELKEMNQETTLSKKSSPLSYETVK